MESSLNGPKALIADSNAVPAHRDQDGFGVSSEGCILTRRATKGVLFPGFAIRIC